MENHSPTTGYALVTLFQRFRLAFRAQRGPVSGPLLRLWRRSTTIALAVLDLVGGGKGESAESGTLAWGDKVSQSAQPAGRAEEARDLGSPGAEGRAGAPCFGGLFFCTGGGHHALPSDSLGRCARPPQLDGHVHLPAPARALRGASPPLAEVSREVCWILRRRRLPWPLELERLAGALCFQVHAFATKLPLPGLMDQQPHADSKWDCAGALAGAVVACCSSSWR